MPPSGGEAVRAPSVALPHDTPTGPVGWVTGAAVMFRFTALRGIGGFDPEYFLYYEEVDWALRRGDLPLAYCPGGIV